MADIGRRDFLQSAAAASAISAIGAPGAQAAVQGKAPGKLGDIDHFIILMKENRSFDHYFGTLRGVRGFDDPSAVKPDGSSVFRQPDPLSPGGHVLPFRLNTLKTNAQRYHALDHGWGPLHESWNGGAMDNWIPAHRIADGEIGPMTMGYYVSSTVFDHTSVLRLLETRFGVEISNLSKWRRETCGDLAAAFSFGAPPRFDIPKLPETEHALRMAEERAMGLGPPVIPANQVMPRQEPGSRPRRA